MGMGAPKQGSTLPPQGGKGGVQQPVRPQVPMAGGKGAVGSTPQITGYPPVQQPTYLPVGTPLPGGPVTQSGIDQAKIMNAGKGVGTVQPGQVPAQGGKGRDFGPNVFPGPKITYGSVQEQNDASARDRAAKGMVGFEGPNFTGQPAQVPAQGGKAPLTPEQQAALGPYINPARPIPQVLPQQPMFPGMGLPPAQVMPRPVPQVMPRQPTPKPAPMQPQGIAQIQQFLKQQEMLRGRR